MESALELVVGKLSQKIQSEATLVYNFKQDFKWLQTRLTMLKATVQSADENLQFATEDRERNMAVQQWIEDVRDTLWDAEDIIDEISVHEDIPYYQLIVFRYKMGRRIREIKERMKSIIGTANEWKSIRDVASFETGSSGSTVHPVEKWKKTSMLEYGSLPVAVDIKVRDIIKLLADPAIHVIAVVGMGGIGKTFLLQHVYNQIKHMFEGSVWLSVSQRYSLEQLQGDLACKLDLKDVSGADCITRAEIIEEGLKQKMCLIVLDDVWSTEENDLLRNLGIPIGVKSPCKVIVTSRNKKVFSHLHPSIYQMDFLLPQDSWKLFCFHASPPANLEMLAREIEKECGRLPLAIKTVASSLAKETTHGAWMSKLRQVKEVRGVLSDDPIKQVLKLSYYWLPSFLKSCFVFLSFFPEDQQINCEYLVHLWIAEGFIPQTEDQVDKGWDYLRQLADLCLVDVWESKKSKKSSKGINKYCRVHDLLLELAVQISKENKSAFLAEETSTKGKKNSCRRILLNKKRIDDETIAATHLCCPEVVRTLSLSQNFVLRSIPSHMLSNARVLRVLDLSNTRISTLPESVGDLKLLKLLNLSCTLLKEVPQCVRKLKSLTYLDVSLCEYLSCVPLWIGELVSLQHLNICYCSSEMVNRMPKGVSKLLSLCTLRSELALKLSVKEDEYLRLEDVGNMTCMKEISIQLQNGADMASLARGILRRLVNMCTLELCCKIPWLGRIPLLETITAMKDLETLHLDGNFALPVAMETMGNLTVLTLRNDNSCIEFPKAFGERGGFPNLRRFYIHNFEALEELPEMKPGGMASLEYLGVKDCPRVKNVPLGFQGLTRLREFRFIRSGSEEYMSRLKDEWSAVQAAKPHLTVDISGRVKKGKNYEIRALQKKSAYSRLREE